MTTNEKIALAIQLTAASPQFQDICRGGAQQDRIAGLIRNHFDAIDEGITLCRRSPGIAAS